MIHDRFEDAVAKLRQGIERNSDNEPLNNDMRMVIEEIGQKTESGDSSTGLLSHAELLLQQAAMRSTRH